MIAGPPAYSEVQVVPQNNQSDYEISRHNQGQGQSQDQNIISQPQFSYFSDFLESGGSQESTCTSNQAIEVGYKSHRSILIGLFQIMIGITCLASTVTGFDRRSGIGAPYGIIGGIPLIITGCFGIVAGKQKTKRFIATFLGLCNMSILASVATVAFGIVSVADTDSMKRLCGDIRYFYQSVDPTSCPEYRETLIIAILLSVIGGIGGLLSLYGSITGCTSNRCSCRTSSSNNQAQSQPDEMVITNEDQQLIDMTTPEAAPPYTPYPGFPTPMVLNLQVQMVPGAHIQMVPNGLVTSEPPPYEPYANVNNAFTGEPPCKSME